MKVYYHKTLSQDLKNISFTKNVPLLPKDPISERKEMAE